MLDAAIVGLGRWRQNHVNAALIERNARKYAKLIKMSGARADPSVSRCVIDGIASSVGAQLINRVAWETAQ
jgi:hypothetical protein